MDRAKPPDDISPHDFFTRWIGEAGALDVERRRKLANTVATIIFHLDGEGGGVYTLRICEGSVEGISGARSPSNLRVRVDVRTWRLLNRGALSAPEALLRRRVKLEGDFLLGLKLHLILG